MKAQIVSILLLMTGSAAGQQTWSDRSRLLPDRLRDLPTVISIYHSPTPVWPELNRDTARFPGKYIWKHATRVNSEAGELEVVEAGSYIWWKDRGWTPNIKLDKAGFARYFNCPGAVIRRGKFYLFAENYRHGDALYAGDALWFVIAKDKDGNLCKGIAVVETEGIVKTQ